MTGEEANYLFTGAFGLVVLVVLSYWALFMVESLKSDKYRNAYNEWLTKAINSEDPRQVQKALSRQLQLSALGVGSKEYDLVLERWWREDNEGRRPRVQSSGNARWRRSQH